MNFTDEDLARAWDRFRRRRAAATVASRRLRPLGWSAATALLLVAVLGFIPAARSATLRVLSLFRISRIAALPLDDTTHAPLANPATERMLQALIANHVQISVPAPAAWVSTPAAASVAAGFPLRYVPASAGAPAPLFRVQGGAAIRLTVNREQTQALLDQAGVQGITLPDNLDGSSVAVSIPRGIAVAYGDCAAWARQNPRGIQPAPPNPGCTVLTESPSPAVSLPPGLTLPTVAEVGLQLLGWTPDKAAEYCRTVDCASTLLIAIPRRAMQSRQVAVDGGQGLLITPNVPRPAAAPRYLLLWSRAGIFYSVAGSGDPRAALAFAARLQP